MMFKTPAGEAEFMATYDAALAQWPVPYTAFHLPTRFGSTHVIACGPEEGPPLVLLHAGGTGIPIWLRNVAAVSQTHRTYLVDNIGDANKSQWTSPLRSRQDCSKWLSDVLDGLKLERAHLGGMSHGGWYSLNFALAFPNRVRSLMLIAPVAFAKLRLAFFFHFLGPMLFPTRAGMHRTIRWLSATGQLVDERLADQMFLAIKHFRYPKGGIFPTLFSDDELSGLQLPTMLLIGEREVLYDPKLAVDRAVKLIPSIRAELVPEAGHLLVLEKPELVNRRMVEFLESAGD